MRSAVLPAVLLLCGTAGCAVVTQGANQTVTIETEPRAGAACQAANTKGSWHLPETPGALTIAKAYGDLTVTCSHPDGARGSQVFTSQTGAAAFGNIILGGVVGAVGDVATGAAYAYPEKMTVELKPAE